MSLRRCFSSASGKGRMATLLSGSNRAAYIAALCLVGIQVGVGIVMKSSQTGGGYSFSPSASVTISEFFKMIVSLVFFWFECRKRAAQGIGPTISHVGYSPVLNAPIDDDEENDGDSVEMKRAGFNGDDHDGDIAIANGNGNMSSAYHSPSNGGMPMKLRLGLYWQYIRSETSRRTQWELCNLALLYLLVNNTIFACYKEADPGTIALVKSGVTVVTAAVMIATVGTRLSRMQWTAIVMQLCGLVITQYSPAGGITYPISTYVLLVFHVFLGASAGVYNQVLLKREVASLHSNNMILYAAGSVFNLIAHWVVRLVNDSEPSFFHGFGNIGAILVIVSNVFVGLAITAVYKYADAVIKCFATAFATGILLYISPILFGTQLGFLAIPGTLIVFVASWLYITNPLPKTNQSEDERPWAAVYVLSAAVRKWPKKVLLVAALHTLGFVILLWAPEALTLSRKPKVVLNSPLRNTMAYVRWNHAIPERVPSVMKYEPFFHSVHISMKDSLSGEPESFLNMTNDQFDNTGHPHEPVAETMKLILRDEPDIEGMLFFHFDAWVSPMDFVGMDLNRIWIPFHGGPYFQCFDTVPTDSWGGDQKKDFYDAVGVASGLRPPQLEEDGEVLTNPKYYSDSKRAGCRGWADIYYVPRRFFHDYIYLVDNVFEGMWHEMAVSTMLHMIDRTRSPTEYTTFIDALPCWGSCCSKSPDLDTVLWHLCGHKLDYQDELVADAHFHRIDSASRFLNTTRSTSPIEAMPEKPDDKPKDDPKDEPADEPEDEDEDDNQKEGYGEDGEGEGGEEEDDEDA